MNTCTAIVMLMREICLVNNVCNDLIAPYMLILTVIAVSARTRAIIVASTKVLCLNNSKCGYTYYVLNLRASLYFSQLTLDHRYSININLGFSFLLFCFRVNLNSNSCIFNLKTTWNRKKSSHNISVITTTTTPLQRQYASL